MLEDAGFSLDHVSTDNYNLSHEVNLVACGLGVEVVGYRAALPINVHARSARIVSWPSLTIEHTAGG